MPGLARRFRQEEGGGAAIEYALILPAFITLIVGSVCAAQLGFAVNSLHFAVEDAARCAAVKTSVCMDASSTLSYAQRRYSGPQISPTFSYSNGGCGHTVTASGNYPIILAVYTLDVPVSASACYP